jgi:hypothetical protein
MAIIKCKMCGGDLEILEDSTVCECAYCGTRQTVPSADNEKKLTLFGRAGRLLRSCEFDKAAGVFETIIADFPQEAEAYWGLVLCKYGIEYVDDPATGKKIPTCHRSSFESVLDDPNFEQACENTDAVARRVYRDEARAIEALREQILAVSGREEPYDVFISYKETDDNGERTLDSVIAQDIYKALTDEGYRVFFSRISLEDKLGTEYEPYIFAALNSAKVMLAVGTDYENYDSVWVKNEWSRFLKLIAKGEKKTLIPVFKNMDAYDMPKEFAKLAAQDMGKVGAMQDLVRGVEKILGKKKAEPTAPQPVVVSGGPNVAAMVERGRQALEDGEWAKADGFFDQALNMDAKCAEAFLGKYCAQEKAISLDAALNARLANCDERVRTEQKKIEGNTDLYDRLTKQYAIPFYLDRAAISREVAYDLSYPSMVSSRAAMQKEETERLNADRLLSRARSFAAGETAAAINAAIKSFEQKLSDRLKAAQEAEEQNRQRKQDAYDAFLAEAEKRIEHRHSHAAELREKEYQSVCKLQQEAKTMPDYSAVISRFNNEKLSGYKDCVEREKQCRAAYAELERQERQRREAEQKAAAEEANRKRQLEEKEAEEKRLIMEAEAAARKKKAKKIMAIAAAAAVLLAAILIAIPGITYNKGVSLMNAGDFEGAIAAFEKCGRLSKAAISYGEKAEKDSGLQKQCFVLWEAVTSRNSIAAGSAHSASIKVNGTVLTAGNNDDGQRKTSDWEGIVDIYARSNRTVGLKSDGTVVAVGDNSLGQCDVSRWRNIVAISAGGSHTIGLKADGTVVGVGTDREQDGRLDFSGWKNIVSISAGAGHSVGLKADGTVVAVGLSLFGQCDVQGWENIIAISAGLDHTVGLKSDGTVIAVGRNDNGQCDVSEWKDIIAISAGSKFSIGLKSDGTVVAVGDNRYGQCDVLNWRDIVAISAGSWHTIGLKSNGTVVAAGLNESGQCNITSWTDIKLPTR